MRNVFFFYGQVELVSDGKVIFWSLINPVVLFLLFHSSDSFIIFIKLEKKKERVDVPRCLTGSVCNVRIKNASVFY